MQDPQEGDHVAPLVLEATVPVRANRSSIVAVEAQLLVALRNPSKRVLDLVFCIGGDQGRNVLRDKRPPSKLQVLLAVRRDGEVRTDPVDVICPKKVAERRLRLHFGARRHEELDARAEPAQRLAVAHDVTGRKWNAVAWLINPTKRLAD